MYIYIYNHFYLYLYSRSQRSVDDGAGRAGRELTLTMCITVTERKTRTPYQAPRAIYIFIASAQTSSSTKSGLATKVPFILTSASTGMCLTMHKNKSTTAYPFEALAATSALAPSLMRYKRSDIASLVMKRPSGSVAKRNISSPTNRPSRSQTNILQAGLIDGHMALSIGFMRSSGPLRRSVAKTLDTPVASMWSMRSWEIRALSFSEKMPNQVDRWKILSCTQSLGAMPLAWRASKNDLGMPAFGLGLASSSFKTCSTRWQPLS